MLTVYIILYYIILYHNLTHISNLGFTVSFSNLIKFIIFLCHKEKAAG